ncbi:MAG: energy transducer TonB [Paludibacter sp.]
MKKQSNKIWKIIGYILIVLFALAFLYSRIRRPLYQYKHSSTMVHNKNLQVEEQKNRLDSNDMKEPFIEIDDIAVFPGGDAALLEYIKNNIRYPAEARKNKEEGKVVVRFSIPRNGKILNAKIIRSLSPSLDKEALRIVNSFPDWTYHKFESRTDTILYNLPIRFELDSFINKR